MTCSARTLCQHADVGTSKVYVFLTVIPISFRLSQCPRGAEGRQVPKSTGQAEAVFRKYDPRAAPKGDEPTGMAVCG